MAEKQESNTEKKKRLIKQFKAEGKTPKEAYDMAMSLIRKK